MINNNSAVAVAPVAVVNVAATNLCNFTTGGSGGGAVQFFLCCSKLLHLDSRPLRSSGIVFFVVHHYGGGFAFP